MTLYLAISGKTKKETLDNLRKALEDTECLKDLLNEGNCLSDKLDFQWDEGNGTAMLGNLFDS